ncbi:hypothetical protein Tco_0020306 [Tanacetum coccineum]
MKLAQHYHSTLYREQHSARELFRYREDSNEAAFVVAAAEKTYAHELLTFNDTIACEVISKWKVGLKEEMDADARSDKAKENVLGMEIFRDQSGNTLRVSQSRFYNRKLVQTLLKGLSILSLEGGLSRDCNVEKNAGVDMLNEFDRGLQMDVHGFVEFDYAMGRSITWYGLMIQGCAVSWEAILQHIEAMLTTEAVYMTLMEAKKEAIWLKGLSTDSGAKQKCVAVVATGALTKAVPGSRFQHWLMLLSIGINYKPKVEIVRISLNICLGG